MFAGDTKVLKTINSPDDQYTLQDNLDYRVPNISWSIQYSMVKISPRQKQGDALRENSRAGVCL